MDFESGKNLSGNRSWNLTAKGGDLSIPTGMEFIFQGDSSSKMEEDNKSS
jgi:hypothetical protein